jgi:TRAP-type C4-dicarboxylate transport system substrate-binding protein
MPRAALTAAAALVFTAAACRGSGADKSGGTHSRGGEPIVLTLAEHDSSFASEEFAAAAEERSGGSIRIDVKTGWRFGEFDYERRTIDDVRSGRVELVIVGARVWDTLAITAFDALLAPFLVDSLALERRVLESPLAARMIGKVEMAGVVGIALLPGALRRPFGKARPLVGARDYRGATIGVRPGRIEAVTFRALGASTRVYESLHPSFFAGAALDPLAIVDGGYKGETLAANVVLWPRAETVVMNRRAFDGLTPEQRKILRAAGRVAIGPHLARIERSEGDAVRAICAQSLVSLVDASPADLAALRGAVQPVYALLERDAKTRQLVAEIRKLGDGVASEPLRCPEAEVGAASELEGRWQATASRKELLAAGATPREVRTAQSRLTIEFDDGRWVARLNTRRVWTGAYTVNGDLLSLTLEKCSHNPCTPGAVAEHRWSVYRDTLSVTRLPGRTFWWRLTAKPFERAR